MQPILRMPAISNILKDTLHRPYELPAGQWQYYQEWNNVLFFHWVVPYKSLRNCVPKNLNIDTFDGKAYVSLVAFTMQKIRPKKLPSIPFISNFHEINLRTYINNDNKKGVYFLNIETEKLLSAFIAQKLSGLPYEKARIKRVDKKYTSTNPKKKLFLETEFEIGETILDKTMLDIWLTERYCLYLTKGPSLYRYDIHHKEWELKNLKVKKLNLNYKIDKVNLSDSAPAFIHYSDGIKVLAWKRKQI